MKLKGLNLLFILSTGLHFLPLNFVHSKSLVPDMFSDLFFDNSPKLEIPADFINSKLEDGVWSRPELGYAFQFKNHPTDPQKYIRLESLNLTLAIPAVPSSGLPVQLGPKLTAEFIRPFDKVDPIRTAKDFILTSPPYGPQKVPYNYQNALNLKPNDYFSFTANMALQIAPSTAHITGVDFIGDLAFIRYIIFGDFKVEVYRLSNNKVKVIASNLKSKLLGAGANLRFIPDIEVFGFSLLDNYVNNKIKTNIIDWTLFEKSKSNLFSIAYVYDLNTVAGQKAYDSLMNPVNWKKPILLFNSRNIDGNKPTETSLWLADTSVSQDFVEKKIAGVLSLDNSKMDYEQKSKGIRFDLLIADHNHRRHFLEMDYVLDQTSNLNPQPNSYRIATFRLDQDYQFLFKVSEASLNRETTVIFNTDHNLQITNFMDLHYLYRREDKKLKENNIQKEASSIIGEMRKMLPPELLATELNQLHELLKPAYTAKTESWVQMELSFNPQAFGVLQNLSYLDISNTVDRFLNPIIPLITSDKKHERLSYGHLELFSTFDQLRKTGDPKLFFSAAKLRALKASLHDILLKTNTGFEKELQWDRYKQLENNIIFRDFGSALIIRLLALAVKKEPNLWLRDLVYFKARVKTKNNNEKLIHIGNYSRSETILDLLMQKDRVMNRSYNPFHFIE